MVIVQKYGGTSVASAERIMNVAKRIIEAYKNGNNVVVVVSAQGSMTDGLLEKAREVNESANKRELDMLLCTGEQQSAALMAMAIAKLGYKAISLNAVQVGIEATSLYGNAQIKNVQTSRIYDEFKKGHIVIVAGFQGVNKYNDLTTLGRGASDTTAVALAAVLKADTCEIYTDVDGIFTADPRLVPTAKKLNKIGYDDMLELTASGLQKPHNRAIEMAKRYSVKILVRSSMNNASGTWIMEGDDVERLSVSGLVIDRNVARVTLMGLQDEPGVAFKIFSLLAKKEISVDVILQSVGLKNTRDISFTVLKQDLRQACEILNKHKEEIDFETLDTGENLAKLTVVGAGMATNFGIASDMFQALYESDVNIQMIATSEIKISVLVDERDVSKATKAVHDKFDLIFDMIEGM